MRAVLALGLVLVAAPAAAQNDRERALELFEESQTAYNAGDLERATALLRAAHALHPEPILLYNLGRALEGLGETEEAAEAYERYLAEGTDIEDRAAIERRVATLRRVDPQEAVVEPPSADDPPPPRRDDTTAIIGFTIFGLGAAIALVSIPLGVLTL